MTLRSSEWFKNKTSPKIGPFETLQHKNTKELMVAGKTGELYLINESTLGVLVKGTMSSGARHKLNALFNKDFYAPKGNEYILRVPLSVLEDKGLVKHLKVLLKISPHAGRQLKYANG
jgi:hypothetical protein